MCEMPMRKVVIVIIGLAFFATVPGCAQPPVADSDRIRIVASFYPVANFARQVAGDRAEVATVIPSGLEPHDYEPTARDLALIYDSPIFIYSGAGLEPWAEKIRPELEARGIHVLRLSDVVELLSGVSGEVVREANQSDPHIWLDPVLAQRQVELIRDALVSLDPSQADDYQRSAADFLTKLKSLDLAFAEGLSDCKDHTVLLSHAAFQYLAKRYGFRTLSVGGFSEEQEPSPKDFAGLIDSAKRLGLHFIFFERRSNPRLAETLAAEIGGETLDLVHIDGGFSAEESADPNLYFDQMRANLEQLRKAMECK